MKFSQRPPKGRSVKFLVSLLLFMMVLNNSLIASIASAADSIKILALGDSITQATSNRASYRYPLWKKLIDAGIDFDFVGSMNKHLGADIPPQADYKGLIFDSDHEGHYAWTADEIIHGRSIDNGTGTGNLKGWLSTYDVDIALIHLGTNDAFMRQSNSSTASDLKIIISLLREDNPRVVVLLAMLIPSTYSRSDSEALISLNTTITKLSKGLNTAESPVLLVDQFSGFNGETDLYDKVHPNARGEEKMAARWYDALRSALKK